MVNAPLFATFWSKDLKRFFLCAKVFRSSDEFLHGIHVEKLMNVVVVSEEIRWDFPRPFELAVFSDHRLDLFNETCIRGYSKGCRGLGCRRIEASWPLRTGRSRTKS